MTFPADEGLQTEEFLDTFINIFDDEVDEAEKQRFVAYLELLDAVDLNLIEITRDAAICIIADNDGKSPTGIEDCRLGIRVYTGALHVQH